MNEQLKKILNEHYKTWLKDATKANFTPEQWIDSTVQEIEKYFHVTEKKPREYWDVIDGLRETHVLKRFFTEEEASQWSNGIRTPTKIIHVKEVV